MVIPAELLELRANVPVVVEAAKPLYVNSPAVALEKSMLRPSAAVSVSAPAPAVVIDAVMPVVEVTELIAATMLLALIASAPAVLLATKSTLPIETPLTLKPAAVPVPVVVTTVIAFVVAFTVAVTPLVPETALIALATARADPVALIEDTPSVALAPT